jgi:hypothetical protein
VPRPAGLRSRFTGTVGRGAARLQANGARGVKCEDRDPDAVNDGVALVDDIRQSVSRVLVRDGGHCRVGIAERTLVAEASDDKGFAVLCDPASGPARTGPRESEMTQVSRSAESPLRRFPATPRRARPADLQRDQPPAQPDDHRTHTPPRKPPHLGKLARPPRVSGTHQPLQAPPRDMITI